MANCALASLRSFCSFFCCSSTAVEMMNEEDMSLQLSMALSGINSEEWKEFKELYEQGKATLNRLRRSSGDYSLSTNGSSEGSPSFAMSSEGEDTFESCLEGAAWGAPLSPFAMEAHYRCIRQIMKHIKNRNYIQENNMEIIKIFTEEDAKIAALQKAAECDGMVEEFQEEAVFEMKAEEEAESDDGRKSSEEAQAAKKSNEDEKSDGGEDEQEVAVEVEAKCDDEPKYKELPYPINSFKVTWSERNLLDLSTNLLKNASMYMPARIPYGVPGYFENRSQISRMKGASPPPHSRMCCSVADCGFEESFFN